MMMLTEFISSDFFTVNRTHTLREGVCIPDHKNLLSEFQQVHIALASNPARSLTEKHHISYFPSTRFSVAAIASHSNLPVGGGAQKPPDRLFPRHIFGAVKGVRIMVLSPSSPIEAFLRNVKQEINPKMIQITEIARKRIAVLKQDQETNHGKKIEGLRLVVKSISPSPEYALAFVERGKTEMSDTVVEVDGIKLFMESRHANLLEDVKIDFITGLQQTGFKVDNPKVIESKPATPATPPNLESPQAKAVQQVIETEINPGVAAHGGYITLVDVKDEIAYIRLGGGCQGCGMSNVTLKQGVVVAIKKAIPEIKDVVDVTDHAGGTNPYYTPGK